MKKRKKQEETEVVENKLVGRLVNLGDDPNGMYLTLKSVGAAGELIPQDGTEREPHLLYYTGEVVQLDPIIKEKGKPPKRQLTDITNEEGEVIGQRAHFVYHVAALDIWFRWSEGTEGAAGHHDNPVAHQFTPSQEDLGYIAEMSSN